MVIDPPLPFPLSLMVPPPIAAAPYVPDVALTTPPVMVIVPALPLKPPPIPAPLQPLLPESDIALTVPPRIVMLPPEPSSAPPIAAPK